MDNVFRDSRVDLNMFMKITAAALDEMIAVGTPGAIPIDIISSSDYNVLIKELKCLLKSSDFETAKIQERLSEYDANKVTYFCNAVNDKRMNLIKSCIAEHNSTYGELVTDYDWRLSLVIGTSTSDDLRYPVLGLDLQTLSSGDRVIKKKRNFEFTKEELDKLIQVLEDNL